MNAEQKPEAKPEAPKVELRDELLDGLMARFPKAITGIRVQRPARLYASLRREDLLEIIGYIKKDLGFDHLSSISGADYADRFEVVYHLWSYSTRKVLTLKVPLPKDDPRVQSLTSLWKSADWYEREAYDMYGIKFEGHPNLTRILLPEDFEGFPFRKDWKLVENPWYEGKEVPKEE
ncbi:MAG: NADH-quinone oxidoreductase subunit C [Candidatus Hydrothermarchaeota archaeon]